MSDDPRPAGPVDLHMHTSASDGDLEPEELMRRCAEAGLRTVALTDHNTTRNVPRAAAAAEALGLELVPACEISTRWRDREQHCLAYFVPLDDAAFAERIERVRRADLERCRAWVANARREGFRITWEELEARAGADRVVPFAVLRQALLELNPDDRRLDACRSSPGRLWGEWFAAGRPLAAEPPYQPGLPEAISWVREAGGVPVLAHPGATLGELDPDTAFGELGAEGLAGVEAWTTWHRPEQSERFEAIAERHGLTVTAGADFHGPTVKPFVGAPGQVTHNGPERLLGLLRAREAA